MVARKMIGVPIAIGKCNYSWTLLVSLIVDTIVIGLDCLKAHNGQIDLANDTVVLKGEQILAEIKRNQDECYTVQRVVQEKKGCSAAKYSFSNQSKT